MTAASQSEGKPPNSNCYRVGIALLTALMLATLPACPFTFGDDLVLSGTAYHAASKAPFEGALVLGIYKQCRSGFAATTCFCVRTAAVRTGPDGTFRFPVTPTEGKPWLAIFAPNHYLKDAEMPLAEVLRKRDKSSYLGWDLWLATQDPENPDFRYESGSDLPCREPASQEAAEAGLEFGKAINAERARLLQLLVDSARQKPMTPKDKSDIARMEYEIDVLLLGDAAAREKQDKFAQRRAMFRGCRFDFDPQSLVCCFGFVDTSRTPLLAEILKKEKIKFELEKGSVCVRRQDEERVGELQRNTP